MLQYFCWCVSVVGLCGFYFQELYLLCVLFFQDLWGYGGNVVCIVNEDQFFSSICIYYSKIYYNDFNGILYFIMYYVDFNFCKKVGIV